MNIISTVINFTKNLMENNIENSTQDTTDDNIKYNNIIFYTKLFESTKSIIYIDPSDEYILKKYTPNKITQKHVENEIYILHKLSKHNNDNIIRLLSSLSETVNNKITYSLLFNKFGEDLFEYINKNTVSPEILNNVVGQLMKTVSFLHSLNIAHCDIKCENILIQNGSIKLCDFGFATYMDVNHRIYNVRGTFEYISPNLYRDKEADGRLNDLWSIGIVICMIVYNTPFEKTKYYDDDFIEHHSFWQYFDIEFNKYSFTKNSNKFMYKYHLKNLLRILLTQNESNRYKKIMSLREDTNACEDTNTCDLCDIILNNHELFTLDLFN